MEQFNPFVPKVRHKEEVWKHHPRFKRLQISKLGRYKILLKTPRKNKYNWSEPRFATRKQGYSQIRYRLLGKEQVGEKKEEQLYVHHLVAELFCENPDNKPWIDHLDGNAHNPAAYNLEFVTPKENNERAVKLGLRKAGKPVVKISLFEGTIQEYDSIAAAGRELNLRPELMKKLIESGQQDIFGVLYQYKEAA